MPPACGQQKCKLEACATFGLFSFAHPSFIIPTGAKHGGGERSGGISYTPDFRKAVRASPLLSFRPERSAVEESLYTRDFRKAVRASPLLSFRPKRSVVDKSLGAPEFREPIRA